MEENALPPQNTNSTSNNTGKKEIKGFTLLKMGVLEIAFVGVILLLFFGVLNYFNILSVSSAFPEYLSWLPRQEVKTNLQTNSALQNTPAPLSTPTPIPTPTPTELEKNVKQTFMQTANTILTNSTIPESAEVQILSNRNKENSFNISWIDKEIQAAGNITFSTTNNIISTLSLNMVLNQYALPSLQLAEKLISQFTTLQPQGTWKCNDISVINITRCENFWQEENGIKMGAGIEGPVTLSDDKERLNLFLCKFGENSNSYNSESCF